MKPGNWNFKNFKFKVMEKFKKYHDVENAMHYDCKKILYVKYKTYSSLSKKHKNTDLGQDQINSFFFQNFVRFFFFAEPKIQCISD